MKYITSIIIVLLMVCCFSSLYGQPKPTAPSKKPNEVIDTVKGNAKVSPSNELVIDSTNQEYYQDLRDRSSIVIEEAMDKLRYYESNLKNKSYSKVADYLYDEGFKREIKMEYINYYITWSFDNGDYYTIKVKTWLSYGYGKSFYETKLNAKLKDYGFIVIDNEPTGLLENLK